jgi:hypothetical protein
MSLRLRASAVVIFAVVIAAPAVAHVGSPDVFFEGDAGPYRLYVTVRPPPAIPGIAEVEVRSATPNISSLAIFPMRVVGPASKNPPTPERREDGVFSQSLPSLPAGRYRLFADVVYETGFPATLVADLDLPAIAGTSLEGEDSVGMAARGSTPPGSTPRASTATPADTAIFLLDDGSRVTWNRTEPLHANRMHRFRFHVEDQGGSPANDLEPYMGMPGHAVFLRRDLSAFAHVHPVGSVSMPALALAEESLTGVPVDPHAAHASTPHLPADISFPYGLPSPGDYRIFVQFKRAGRVQTAVFDTHVDG